MIKGFVLNKVLIFIQKNSDKPIVKKITNLCIHITRLAFNSNYSPETNGKYRVLKIIASQFKQTVIFDVVANRSLRTKKALMFRSVAYSIEPVFEIFNSLGKLRDNWLLNQIYLFIIKAFQIIIVLNK